MPAASVIVAYFLLFLRTHHAYFLTSSTRRPARPVCPTQSGVVAHLTTTPETASVVAESLDGFYREVLTRSASRGTFRPKLNTETQERGGE
ncbi:hypothetical protein B0T18DRAFT_176028 [Schizothecium vesticola]|uniref:Secreted protein n=1 Tax=Schizothecium vesticola TaxID=314040 RepID=A0AA40K227_9PEZI|nr:hypothetical protein B0T18DRAFT_176028 [Schizothecium vesticola]